VLVSKQNSTGSLHVWWLNIGRIEPRKAALLGKSAEIDQIPDAPGLDDIIAIFLFLVEQAKKGSSSSFTLCFACPIAADV